MTNPSPAFLGLSKDQIWAHFTQMITLQCALRYGSNRVQYRQAFNDYRIDNGFETKIFKTKGAAVDYIFKHQND